MTDDLAEDKWGEYPNTVLRFDGDHGSIDLRSPLTSADRSRLATLGLSEPFAVLTAENPCGLNAEDAKNEKQAEFRDERNRERMKKLRALLDKTGIRHVPVDGTSPDGSYCEHSVAVLVEREKAIGIARTFEQLAIFWYDGRDFWLYPAVLDESPLKLPRGSRKTTGNKAHA